MFFVFRQAKACEGFGWGNLVGGRVILEDIKEFLNFRHVTVLSSAVGSGAVPALPLPGPEQSARGEMLDQLCVLPI